MEETLILFPETDLEEQNASCNHCSWPVDYQRKDLDLGQLEKKMNLHHGLVLHEQKT